MKKQILIALCVGVLVVGGVWLVVQQRDGGEQLSESLVSLAVGESGTLRGITLELLDFIQESRCPIDVQCIEAGAVVVRLRMQDASGEVIRNFPSDEAPYVFSNHAISIVGISPDLRSGVTIKKSEYRIVFSIVPASESGVQ